MLNTTSRRSLLLSRLHNARAGTDALFAIVKPEFLFERPISERHRLAFYIGHVDAFDWNLLSAPLGLTSEQPALDTLFAFGIDPVDGQLPSDQPSDWPPLPEFFRYREQARARLDAALQRDDLQTGETARLDQLLNVAIEHRQMHAETLSYLMHQMPFEHKVGSSTHGQPAPRTLVAEAVASEAVASEAGVAEAGVAETVTIPAGKTLFGARSSSGEFGWDNEFEAHAVDVPEFRIDKYKVTNRQYLAFVDDGGYARREFWSDADWAWKDANDVRHPAFWLHQDGRWHWRSMFDAIPLPAEWPVYVSHAEASAYARWAGRALPSEAQWQRAAFGTGFAEVPLAEVPLAAGPFAVGPFAAVPFAAVPFGAGSGAATDDFAERRGGGTIEDFSEPHGGGADDFSEPPLRFDPVAVDSAELIPPGPFPVAGMRGNGWEWTSSVFAPFAGFRRFDFYPGYSEPFFDGKHFVLKGGSVRTAASMLRPSFRNWFQPHYPFVYAGFRCVD